MTTSCDESQPSSLRATFGAGPPLACHELSFDVPNMNLAVDEALLDACENSSGSECLRFWESPVPFVVLGVSQAIHEEANVAACERDGVPVLRRCSAGGAVLQGPGCLNFSLVLRYENRPGTESLRGSYCQILGALVESFAIHGVSLATRGTSDLALGGRKVSGSAQKRRRYAFLHHGTFMYNFQAIDLARYLKEPALRPEYRGQRNHADFVIDLPLGAEKIRMAVCDAFHAYTNSGPSTKVLEAARELVASKYDSKSWVHRR